MRQQIHFVTLSTTDLDAARRFYRDGLGWEPLADVPGEILFFQVAPGTVLGLFDSVKFDRDLAGTQDSGTEAAGPAMSTSAAVSGVTLAHNVEGPEEVAWTVEAMVQAGGRVLRAPEYGGFGGVHHAFVEDPNGVVWEVAHNPGWHVDQSGNVVLG
ncbi:VOC family protein [Nocardiopsis kunsanensis]|uniref:Glyoxalase/bleomycin resistance protein n=1 Tax=Nocardiopsis kunsanensis TaxID=141693 RepID=A0A918XC51_9ACTN|nr:VOC family protein [Nocardiopsis kunsanensis]GHD25792.1 putative glyoxalase/bleomycin resistance protein [Nocardiopsis kunsanensis]